MKLKEASVIAIIYLFVCSFEASAQLVTAAVGVATLTVNAKPPDIRGFTYLSPSLTRAPVFQGVIPTNGVSPAGAPTTLTFPAHTFTQGQFDGTHYIEVTNGTYAGRWTQITATGDSGTASTITLSEDIASCLTAGTSVVKIRPMWTLGTLFGVNNSAGFYGGPTASIADSVQVFNPATGLTTNYFYNTTNNRWQTGLTDATNAVITPGTGLRIERKLTSPISFRINGAIKTGPTGIFVQGGNNPNNPQNVSYLPNPYPLASVTLANSNLYTGNNSTGFMGAVTPSLADTLSLYNSATGLLTNYYFNTTNNRWQTGLTDASNVTVPEGTAVYVKRKPANGSFIWYVPQPTMNLN